MSKTKNGKAIAAKVAEAVRMERSKRESQEAVIIDRLEKGRIPSS